ncbi:MAG: protease modulator HflC [Chloroflexota bacterium]
MMNSTFSGALVLAIVSVIALLIAQSTYVVNENDQVILLEFGRPVQIDRSPGLYIRKPFVQNVERFERRILVNDAHPQEYLTADKNRLVVDHVSRWRILDPLQFFQTVRTESGALARLDDIIVSELRTELSRFNFTDIISRQRDQIMENVSTRVAETARLQTNGGIEVIDVRIKRADLPEEVQASVYARIIAERSRIASQFRSEGAEQAFRIRADAEKERTIIEARAYDESQRARGEGDARSTEIYASAFNRDAEFYSFVRNLEAYERYLKTKSTLVMSGDGELFRYLNSGAAPVPAPAPAALPSAISPQTP